MVEVEWLYRESKLWGGGGGGGGGGKVGQVSVG